MRKFVAPILKTTTDLLQYRGKPRTLNPTRSKHIYFCKLILRTCPYPSSPSLPTNNRHNTTLREKEHGPLRPPLQPPRPLRQKLTYLPTHRLRPRSRNMGRLPPKHDLPILRRPHHRRPPTRDRYLLPSPNGSFTRRCRTGLPTI